MVEIGTQVQGIPCIVQVMHHSYIEPDPHADSSEVFNGGWELCWHLCDLRGAPAPWIEVTMTDEDRDRIEQEIIEELS